MNLDVKTLMLQQQRRDDASNRVEAALKENHPLILVHQMGKVGSTSISDALDAVGLHKSVFHLHYLSGQLDKVAQYHVDHGIVPEPVHIFESYAIREAMAADPGLRPKVISLVRDPVARQISNVFQNPAFAKGEICDAQGNLDSQKITDYVNEQFDNPVFLWTVNNWFDTEIRDVFGIDVFDTPFSESGVQRYQSDKADLMVFRLEQLNGTNLNTLCEFLGIEGPLEERRGNVRDSTDDADVYSFVKRNVRLSKAVLDKVYDSKFSRYFYNDEQLAAFRQRWG